MYLNGNVPGVWVLVRDEDKEDDEGDDGDNDHHDAAEEASV